MQEDWKRQAVAMAQGIRRRVLRHTIDRNGGYLSQACSSAEIFAVLYTKVLKLKTLDKPLIPEAFAGAPGEGRSAVTGAAYNGGKEPDCDRFILSPAQYSLVLYASLIEAGRMDPVGMKHYDRDGGSVEMIGAEHSPGMEVMTGSLGQGISQAAGIAFARRVKGEAGRVLVLLSDGECQSGQFWEAVQAMSHHRLGNMLLYVDINGYQCDGRTATVMNPEPFDERLRAFGARVFRVDGHDMDRLAEIGLMEPADVPTFILCDTDPCRGMDVLKDRYPKFHYVRFRDEEERLKYKEFYDTLSKEDSV